MPRASDQAQHRRASMPEHLQQAGYQQPSKKKFPPTPKEPMPENMRKAGFQRRQKSRRPSMAAEVIDSSLQRAEGEGHFQSRQGPPLGTSNTRRLSLGGEASLQTPSQSKGSRLPTLLPKSPQPLQEPSSQPHTQNSIGKHRPTSYRVQKVEFSIIDQADPLLQPPEHHWPADEGHRYGQPPPPSHSAHYTTTSEAYAPNPQTSTVQASSSAAGPARTLSFSEACGITPLTAEAPITAESGQTHSPQSHVPARATTWERMRMTNFYTRDEKRYRSPSGSDSSREISEEYAKHRHRKHARHHSLEDYP